MKIIKIAFLVSVSFSFFSVRELVAQVPKLEPGTVQLGSQLWTGKNLEVVAFANGDKIDQVQTSEDWVKAGKEGRPAWCYYENDATRGSTYGKLYNWYAVVDPRGLAPKGWHVPSETEWKALVEFLGAADAGNKIKSSTLWQAVSNVDRNGSNSSGLNGLPAGMRQPLDGIFKGLGTQCHFWSSTKDDPEKAMACSIGIAGATIIAPANMKFGYSVRCVKDLAVGSEQ